ncbi:hypothetical protein ABT040_44875 [Streptomyces sp. NPDC002688]|uniref:hypothetical protein n=1 Tax=Streptomyces sp. NPDC002688 TaxID=3154423 RepID=UPI003321B820
MALFARTGSSVVRGRWARNGSWDDTGGDGAFVAAVQELGHHGHEEAVFLGRKPNFKLSPGYVAHQH